MIISHKHKYLFVETPRTGTTAIGNELVENYDGERILNKHSTHFEFIKMAGSKELQYRKFAGIRNPLDSLVSFFYKILNDSHVREENTTNFSVKLRRQKTLTMKFAAIYYKLQSDFVKNNDVCFVDFFKKYYHLSYTNPVDIDYTFFDRIIRFENLQDDFSSCLKIIGLNQVRPLPFANVTKKPKKIFWEHYKPEIRRRAISLFGPFMERFEYDFPQDWNSQIGFKDNLNYSISKNLKHIFYKSRYLL